MPDLDILHNTPPRGWSKPWRMLVDGVASPSEVAHAAMQSLAADLRRHHGLPLLDDFVTVIQGVTHAQVSVPDAQARIRTIERQAGNGHHVKVAARAVNALVVEISQGARIDQHVRQIVSERYCWGLVDYSLFGRLAAQQASIRLWQETRVQMRPGVRGIAYQLSLRPSAVGLRMAKDTSKSKQSTADLLRTALPR